MINNDRECFNVVLNIFYPKSSSTKIKFVRFYQLRCLSIKNELFKIPLSLKLFPSVQVFKFSLSLIDKF